VSPLNELIQRFLDDRRELSSDELDALIAGLRAEPARAVELREQLLVDDLVAQKLTLDRRNFLAQVEQRIADFEQAESEIDQQVAELHSLASAPVTPAAGPSAASNWLKAALGLALVALVAGFFVLPRFLPQRAHVVAKVIQVGGPVATVRAEERTSLAADQSLYAGQQIESPPGGWLSLEYPDQTKLRIAEGTLVTLDEEPGTGAKRVHLARGELWADVTRQSGGPMQFLTPHAIATVLGTQLRLTVSGDDTLLFVEEGKVRLGHRGNAEPIDVAASESGLATSDSLDLQTVEWPAATEGLAFVFDPFVHRIPQTRNPISGNWLSSPLEVVGSVAVNELNDMYELSGGHFLAPREGEDIVQVSRESREFALELVFSPSPAGQSGRARIVGIESDDGSHCFELSQVNDGQANEGQASDGFVWELRTDAGPPPAPLRFGLDRPGNSPGMIHLTISYREGNLAIFQNSRLIASRDDWHGSLANWQLGPLVIGADSRGHQTWQGSIESLAIYHRWLDSDEVARNVQNYRILSGRVP
jgi:ferric-dicitrate binding protein FerR (iron transport regulator)